MLNYLFPIFIVVFAVSCLCSLLSMNLFSVWSFPDWRVLSGVGILGIFNIVGSYFVWFYLLKVSSISMLPSLSYLTPFVSILFIVLLLGESLSWYQICGFVWILASVYVQKTLEKQQVQRMDPVVPERS